MIATIASSLPAAGSLLLAAGGLVGVLSYRARNRDTNASATARLADATDKLADTGVAIYKASMEALQGRVDDMAAQLERTHIEMGELRDYARSAETAAREAAAEAAMFQAELARAKYDAGVERHALKSEVAARDVRIGNLEHEVQSLREEVATLRAQLGQSERRATERRAADAKRQGDQDARQDRQDDRQGRQDERQLRQDAADRQPGT